MNIWAKCQRIYVLYRISLKQQNLLLSKIPLHDDTLTEHKVTCNHRMHACYCAEVYAKYEVHSRQVYYKWIHEIHFNSRKFNYTMMG